MNWSVLLNKNKFKKTFYSYLTTEICKMSSYFYHKIEISKIPVVTQSRNLYKGFDILLKYILTDFIKKILIFLYSLKTENLTHFKSNFLYSMKKQSFRVV